MRTGGYLRPWKLLRLFALLGTLLLSVSCGGAQGGYGPDGAGRGLALMSFSVADVDNVPLNRVLVWEFSEPVDPATIGPASIHIREGPTFGLTVQGAFRSVGSAVYFEPQLPGLELRPGLGNPCDLSAAGFKPGTTYRISVLGHPEYAAIHNTRGQPLGETRTLEFRTRSTEDPRLFEDPDAHNAPSVIESSPRNGSAVVPVGDALKVGDGAGVRFVGAPDTILISLSENVHPCSIDHDSVQVHVYEQGDSRDGFVPEEDAAPADPFTWGSGTSTGHHPPLWVPCHIRLDQTFEATQLVLTPRSGQFPENALVVVELTSAIQDLGGEPLVPTQIAFTTGNAPESRGVLRIEYDESTPISADGKTAEVHLPRAPSRAQGYLNVAGDGDNGPDIEVPAFPVSLDPALCDAAPNDERDHFRPSADIVLDTGATPNTCRNHVDGSYAVVWEFASFTIDSGITVTLTGVNPAIILVTGPILIRTEGVLDLAGKPGGNGINSNSSYGLPFPSGAKGGSGVAGGGRGGDSQDIANTHPRPDGDYYGKDGWAGYGSPDYPDDPESGQGAGEGNTAAGFTGPFPTLGASSGAGGGGGHTERGGDGGVNINANNGWLASEVRGVGGGPYPEGAYPHLMLKPSAGSGGGAAGYCDCVASASGHHPGCTASGGAGGGGGGFVDLTSGTSITINGTINASGGRGGQGGVSWYIDIGDTGGGGGGSGGGVRLLTPGEIDVTDAIITTAGGAGGVGFVSTFRGGAPPNHGGAGSNGRIVMEDRDGIISGQHAALILPSEGSPGFYRGVFDESRFRDGGRVTSVATKPMFLGPLSAPRLQLPEAQDFRAGVPVGASRGVGATSILVELRGYPLLPDGSMDEERGTGWWTIGCFRDSGSTEAPEWVPSVNPGDVALPRDNQGVGIEHLDGMGFVQVRLTFFAPDGMPVGHGGPYVDRLDLRFEHDDL